MNTNKKEKRLFELLFYWGSHALRFSKEKQMQRLPCGNSYYYINNKKEGVVLYTSFLLGFVSI